MILHISRTIAEHSFLIVLSAVSVLPFSAIFFTSVKGRTEYLAAPASLAPPTSFTLENYFRAWSELGFDRMTVNSAVLAFSTAALTTLIGLLGGYGLGRSGQTLSRYVLGLCIAGMSIPAMALAVPLYRLAAWTGMVNTYSSAIFILIGINTPLAVFLGYTFVRDLPEAIFEAAELDGAGSVRQFYFIVLPLLRPIVVTIFTVTAVFAWNDLIIPLLFWQDSSKDVLMTGLANLAPGRGGSFVEIPVLMAGVGISILPVILVFALSQRHFVRGFAQGGLK